MRVYQFRHVGNQTTCYYILHNARQLVPTEGLEPPHLAAHGPEPCASTNSATWALDRFACIARRCRRIPLRYQALPFCARPTFVCPARIALQRFVSGWAVSEETESIADEWQMSKALRTGQSLHVSQAPLGESAGPPLHYACQRVNVTISAPPCRWAGPPTEKIRIRI